MTEKIPFGWKSCRHCNELVHGRRTLVCPHCEGNLAKLDSSNDASVNEDGVALRTVWTLPGGYDIPDGHINRVTIPAGVAPIALQSNDPDDIIQWAMDVRQLLLNQNTYIENTGLIYWARTMLNKNSDLSKENGEALRASLASLPDIVYKEVPVAPV